MKKKNKVITPPPKLPSLELPVDTVHSRYYGKSVPFEQNTTKFLVIDPNPYIRKVELMVDIHMITLQMPPHPFNENNQCLRLADVYVRRKNLPWEKLESWVIPIPQGLREPLDIRIDWKSCSDFADVNPPFIRPDTRLCVWVQETMLTGAPIGLPATGLRPEHPYMHICKCGTAHIGTPITHCVSCKKPMNLVKSIKIKS